MEERLGNTALTKIWSRAPSGGTYSEGLTVIRNTTWRLTSQLTPLNKATFQKTTFPQLVSQNSTVHRCVQNSTPLDQVTIQTNLIHILSHNDILFHYNITLNLLPMSYTLALHSNFFLPNLALTASLPYLPHALSALFSLILSP